MKNFNLLTEKNRFQFKRHLKLEIAAIFTLAGTFLTTTPASSQTPPIPKKYVCYRTDQKIVIDGKLDEKSWTKAEWTSTFVDIEGDKKPLPLQKTQAKMLWDDKYLYIAAVLDEQHIWAYQNKKDQIVYLENDFEVFIDPDNDTDNYYELEINAINNSFDLFLPKPYRHGGKPQLDWNIKDLKSAVSIEGTLNNPDDKDKRWTLEIAIPFSSLSNDSVPAVFPANNSEWRINFSRVNWQFELDQDGKYSRKKNPETGKTLPEFNWVWSPQGIINMHYPEYWGFVRFSSQKVGKVKAAVPAGN